MAAKSNPTRAPIALFVYARPDHTERTIKALATNHGAAETDLIIYCDGARGDADRSNVDETRRVAASSSGFRSVTLVEHPGNLGLAENIISGVSETCKRHGRVIVLEDDIVTAPGFLDYIESSA